MNDQTTLISFTLVPGVVLVFAGLIGIFMMIWDELLNVSDLEPGIGFNSWFWKTFRPWIIGMIILGIILISIFYACQVV